jgi:SNF2 family DNA or RNA helicase
MEFEKNIENEAEKLLEKKCVKDIVFSKGTFEVNVFDDFLKNSYWPFLQIDDKKKLIDSFCTCDESENTQFCRHIIAAYFFITKEKNPYHVLFEKSVFNVLCELTAHRIGCFLKNLQISDVENGGKKYFFSSSTNRELFSIKGFSKDFCQRLEEIFENSTKNKSAYDENSLKYSHLSSEEISLLKQNKASNKIKYELSSFSDIAKHLFFLFEMEAKYDVEFHYSKKDVLYGITFVFENEVEVFFYVSFANWKNVIPTLKNINSDLKVFETSKQAIKAIEYDELNRKFIIDIDRHLIQKIKEDRKGLSIGEYYFVKKEGFYLKSPKFLIKNPIIERNKISYILSEYTNYFKNFLKNDVKINIFPKKAKYSLYFDDADNLHIALYVFDKNDFDETSSDEISLVKNLSDFFYPYAYIHSKKTFFFLEDLHFDKQHTIIKKENISEFVTTNRMWLANFEEFKTNFGSIESKLTYFLTNTFDLHFNANLEFCEDFENVVDFDTWVYVKKRGFYAKSQTDLLSPIRPGLIINNDDIYQFITNHQEELEQVSNFFTDKNPFKKISLKIEVKEIEKIQITPLFELKDGFLLEDLVFFDDFVYIKNVGFYRLEPKLRLPKAYRDVVTIAKNNIAFFITYELDKLQKFASYIDPKLKKPKNLNLEVEKIIKKKRLNKVSWEVLLTYTSEIGRVNATKIYEALISSKKYYFSEAGLISLKNFRFNWLKQLSKKRVMERRGFILLTTLEWLRLFIYEDITISFANTITALETKKLLQELSSFETDKMMDISLLNATLRSYQEIGAKWLFFLYCHKLSGLLCDDMGLGKTHQAMSLFAAVSADDKDKTFKYLVVCPTSVIYHWQNLIEKFLPSFKSMIYHGISRNFQNFEENDLDIIISSYGIVRQDIELFKSLKFEVAIFDEVQIAKNQNSQVHKALTQLKYNTLIGLSGTPMENRLKELKTVFDLVLPSYLPPDSTFREMFINPIEKYGDNEKKKLLKNLIKPFVLRRKKQDVLQELPAKIEEIAYCDLSKDQRKLYREYVFSEKEKLLYEIEKDKKPVNYTHVFAFITKLKQICDHPAIVENDVDKYTKYSSGKWDLFVELLHEARESSQKVVVFSQYLGMISIIEKYLKKKKIGYASIKGSTQKRYEQIARFHEDKKCEVFVASLLAGGVGIDLSAASVVIHYDRWWNSAKENQATDRVHRLGQRRGVQVFKLVTKNTIEEHIHSIIERKQHLIEEMIQKDEKDQVRYLDKKELVALLREVALEADSIEEDS